MPQLFLNLVATTFFKNQKQVYTKTNSIWLQSSTRISNFGRIWEAKFKNMTSGSWSSKRAQKWVEQMYRWLSTTTKNGKKWKDAIKLQSSRQRLLSLWMTIRIANFGERSKWTVAATTSEIIWRLKSFVNVVWWALSKTVSKGSMMPKFIRIWYNVRIISCYRLYN